MTSWVLGKWCAVLAPLNCGKIMAVNRLRDRKFASSQVVVSAALQLQACTLLSREVRAPIHPCLQVRARQKMRQVPPET